MVDKTRDDMSMDEILNSIRKYVTSDSKDKESEEPKAKDKKETEEEKMGVIRLTPLQSQPKDEEAEEQTDIKNITMPEFFQKAKQAEEKPAEPAPESAYIPPEIPAEIIPEPPVIAKTPEPQTPPKPEDIQMDPTAEAASRQAFSAFYQQAQMLHQQAAQKSSQPPSSTLDNIVQVAVKQAVTEWINANMPSLVERLVVQEIQKLTESLLKPQG